MEEFRLRDIDLLKVGSQIQLIGGLWQGEGKTYLSLVKGEEVDGTELVVLKMDIHDWETFLRQTDLLETEILQNDGNGIKKAIVRKTQRMIDGALQWRTFKRDGYKCRYCGNDDIQLTVDHADLWEEGGATILENLVSSCKKCNRTRGNMQYEDWLKSEEYKKLSVNLPEDVRKQNEDMVGQLPHLRTLKVLNRRSR